VKVTVTHLKAPWPAGTVPGHVVDFPGLDAIPAWAVGKCVPAADDAEAVSSWPVVVAPAELTSEPVMAPAGEPVVNPEAVTEAQAAAGSGDAAVAPAATGKKKAQAAAG
jgi:hypothetical protein